MPSNTTSPQDKPPVFNPFISKATAKRYARSRPLIHGKVMQHLREFTRLQIPISQAVDVACGTGFSTVALTELAEYIVGVDISPHMLAQATQDSKIHYLLGKAENLPIKDNSSDLVTISCGFHWLDQAVFLTEAARILHDAAWLIIYENAFKGIMVGTPAFQTWVKEVYNQRYPQPPRHPYYNPDHHQDPRFFFRGRENYEEDNIHMNLEQLVNYLMTHSNIIAATEFGTEQGEAVEAWLKKELAVFFPNPTQQAPFIFSSSIWYLQRVPRE